MLAGNIGEWSEMYVLLRLVGEGKLYAADENLQRKENMYFPIIRVIREEENAQTKEYVTGPVVRIYLDGNLVEEVPQNEFVMEADYLLRRLREDSKSAAFPVPNTINFMDKIYCSRIAALPKAKSDIMLDLIDVNTGYQSVVGFSIKSELGHSPTLLNAGKTTNFVFRVEMPDGSHKDSINEIVSERRGKIHKNIRGRIQYIYSNGGRLVYDHMANQNFKDNLILIDSRMEEIIASTMLYYYRDKIDSCKSMMDRLETENPMGFGNVNAYRYKYKKFLSAVALGMKPGTPWDGIDEANGGYIVVSKSGDVVAYHIYNRNSFEEYLLSQTRYETASTTRHDFGDVFTENGKDYICLNLQVRFA